MCTTDHPPTEYVAADGQCFILVTNDNFHMRVVHDDGTETRLNTDLDSALSAIAELKATNRSVYLGLYCVMAKRYVNERRQLVAAQILLGERPDPTRSYCTCGRPMSHLRNGLTFCTRCDAALSRSLKS